MKGPTEAHTQPLNMRMITMSLKVTQPATKKYLALMTKLFNQLADNKLENIPQSFQIHQGLLLTRLQKVQTMIIYMTNLQPNTPKQPQKQATSQLGT